MVQGITDDGVWRRWRIHSITHFSRKSIAADEPGREAKKAVIRQKRAVSMEDSRR